MKWVINMWQRLCLRNITIVVVVLMVLRLLAALWLLAAAALFLLDVGFCGLLPATTVNLAAVRTQHMPSHARLTQGQVRCAEARFRGLATFGTLFAPEKYIIINFTEKINLSAEIILSRIITNGPCSACPERFVLNTRGRCMATKQRRIATTSSTSTWMFLKLAGRRLERISSRSPL